MTSLFAAFNIADGTVISDLHRRHRHQEFLKFLKKIDKNVPSGLDVHLVCLTLLFLSSGVRYWWRLAVGSPGAGGGWCGRIFGVESSGNWLELYRRGQRELVWHELRQVGSAVREPGHFEEAQLVCDEMARRARQNIEVIVERLASAGYRFHANDDEQRTVTPYVPPTAAAVEVAGWLEERFGSVPMTLLSWLRLVGDVWPVGTHPHWAASAAGDPLVIELEGSRYPSEPMQRYFEGELEAWHEWAGADRMFVLPVAPDRLHKDNVSGGPPYGIILPDGCTDGLFVGETTMPFVSYLNWVFSNGGFPWPTAPATTGS